MGAYLMVYHKDADHSLHMALSRDGYSWKALNGDKPVVSGDTIAQQHGIRDPHIYRGPDGAYYIAATDLHIFGKRDGYRNTEWERDGKEYGWGNNRALVLMKSKDLIHWTHTSFRIDKAFPDHFGQLGCAWAPETIWDPEEGRLMVYFTIRPTGKGKTKAFTMPMPTATSHDSSQSHSRSSNIPMNRYKCSMLTSCPCPTGATA